MNFPTSKLIFMHNLLLCKKKEKEKDGVTEYFEILWGLKTVGKGAYISPRSSTVLRHEI